MIRYADWRTITRSTTLRNPIDQKNDILKEAEHLFLNIGIKILSGCLALPERI